MKKVIATENIPIKLWLEDLEEGAVEQAKNLANLPFAFKHISIMPDSHQGYGMPIGSVLATKGVVVPNAVGVDIGCGMCAVKTNLTEISEEELKATLGSIRRRIPVGFKHHAEAQYIPEFNTMVDNCPIVKQEYQKAKHQIGTLGGGNHFIEIQKGSDGHIWIMIHSGSRNLGYTVAKFYNKKAIELNEMYHSSVPTNHQLAFLPLNTQEARDYINEMNYCVEFALANRRAMMFEVFKALNESVESVDEVWEELFINESHNFVAREHHFGHNVLVHRKGATRARRGELGMIPGSQGTKSYIVAGKGEAQSFESCSHGAGRVMSRKKAREELNLDEEIKSLDDRGILHAIRGKSDLDEAPSCYKDIDVVMENQKDLVNIDVELTPLAVIKG